MKEYLLSLLAAAPVLAIVGILAPEGVRSGLAKHLRLVAALVWICILIAPITSMVIGWTGWQDGDSSFGEEQPDENDYQIMLDETLGNQSTAYFCDMLTQTLEKRFSIAKGELRCHVAWAKDDGEMHPEKATLFLSGNAIWKSPKEMEAYVKELIGCECVTVVE